MFENRKAQNPAAREVLAILEAGEYETADGERISVEAELAASDSKTRLFEPDELERLRNGSKTRGDAEGRIEVVAETTQQAARRLAAKGSLVLLNFASARNPGGGFLGGAKAQEEELCRCSGLYGALITQHEYYVVNRRQKSLLYTDYLIYSPEVPFFRVSGKAPFERPFFPSVITAPAPNAGALLNRQRDSMSQIRATFDRRWANVLAAAEDNDQRVLRNRPIHPRLS